MLKIINFFIFGMSNGGKCLKVSLNSDNNKDEDEELLVKWNLKLIFFEVIERFIFFKKFFVSFEDVYCIINDVFIED